MVAPRSVPPPSRSSRDPAVDTEGERGSHVMRFGAAVTATVLASAVGTLPAAVRIAPAVSAYCSAASVWVAVTAVVLLPMSVATLLLRRAHSALRLFDPSAISRGLIVAIVWGLATFAVLSQLGRMLRANTHHHGLAGVTFAGLGLGLCLVVGLFARRAVDAARLSSPPIRWALISVGGLTLGVSLASLFHILSLSQPASAWCADAAALGLASAFGALVFPAGHRPYAPLALSGPPLAAVVLVLGFAALGSAAPLRAALEDRSPVLGAVLTVVRPSAQPPPGGLANGTPAAPPH